jgi:alpha-methylacyl-CoA racemase
MDVFEGVRVIEMASWQFVPAAAAVLAEFGADEYVTETRTPAGEPVGLVRAPVRIDGCAEPLRPAPGLGEHTDEVLGEIGYAPGDIVALRRSGTVG